MQKYEYDIIPFTKAENVHDTIELKDWLNQRGDAGWQLVQIDTENGYWFFMRTLVDDSPKTTRIPALKLAERDV